MASRPARPTEPPSRHDTLRRTITAVLRGRTLSARDISAEVGIPEREVYGHLYHIRKSLARSGGLTVIPSECKHCGFVFRKRERLEKPGKCPSCHGQSIREPLFTIR